MVIIIGLPNSGKTTFSERFKNVIHFDSIPHRYAYEQYQKCNELAAQAEGDVCIEGLYNSKRSRMELLKAIADKPGKRICIWLDTPVEECCRRENRHRPIGIVHAHARSFQPPSMDEGWDEIVRVVLTKKE